MPTTADYLARLVQAKTDISSAITAKGGTVNAGDGLEEFPADIATIPTGSTIEFNYSFDTVPLQPNKTPTGWVDKTWNGYSYPDATIGQIWTDGTNIYFDGEDLDDLMLIHNMVLDKSTSTWVNKQWNFDLAVNIDKLSAIEKNVWTDGTNIYYSDHSDAQLVLDKSTSTWYVKTWNGSYIPPSGYGIWSDGTNIYCSDSINAFQCVLDKSTSTWNVIDSTYPLAYAVAQSNYSGNLLFKFNDTIYYSNYNASKYFEPSTNTWSTVHFYINSSGGTEIYPMAHNFWTDGCNVYCSPGYPNTYKVCSIPNSKDLILVDITTDISSPSSGQSVWTDGDNIYMSANYTQKQLTYTKSLNQLTLRPLLT